MGRAPSQNPPDEAEKKVAQKFGDQRKEQKGPHCILWPFFFPFARIRSLLSSPLHDLWPSACHVSMSVRHSAWAAMGLGSNVE